MNLAMAELRRAKGRYAAITGALSLIVFLVLVLGALGDGLFYGATGAIRSSSATAYAFNSEAPGSLVRSKLDPATEEKLREVPGVAASTAIAALITTTASVPGGADLVVMGYEVGQDPAGVPTKIVTGRLPGPDEQSGVLVDESLAEAGLGIGSQLKVGDVTAEVVGVAADAQYQGLPTAWTGLSTFAEMRSAVRPETAGQPVSPATFALRLDEGASAGDLAVPSGVTVLTSEETFLSIPGVREQKSSLNAIVFASLAVGGLVVALFFALVVLEKRELFAALKALGASTRKLGSGVVFQALGATISAVVIGALAARVLGMALPGSIPFLFRVDTLVVSGLLTVAAGVIGALFSLRRISRIDPATALGGTL